MIQNLIHSMLVCPEMDKHYKKIVRADGVFLYDTEGNAYLDGTAGSAAVANLGHSIQGISDVMKAQMDQVAIIPTHAFRTEELEDYLQKLVAFAPEGFSAAWTATSGSEAVEQAVKLALQYHQLNGEGDRYKIISRWGSYHGNSVFSLDIGGMKTRRSVYDKWMHNFPHVSPSYNYRRPDGMSEEEYAAHNIQELERCIIETGPETIAAFIAEPVVGAALGAVGPVDGYFQAVRRLCDKYGILMISDEVMAGFGRLGTNFGIEHFGVTPDIIAAGKGISAGYYPLSAILAHQKVMAVFESNKAAFLGGHTYACNPVGAVVGSFVIDYMLNNKVVENSRLVGAYFIEQLQVLYRHQIVGDIRGTGLLLGIEFVADKITRMPFPRAAEISRRLVEKVFSRNVLVYPGKGTYDGTLGDHILICPPLIITREQTDLMVRALDESLGELCEELQQENSLIFENR